MGHEIIEVPPRRRPMPEGFVPFPTDVLPEPVLGYVRNGAKALGCDESYVALPLLSALAAAIGNSRRIKLKESWCEPAILWTAIVGESGTLKSPALALAIRPLRDRQEAAFGQHEAAMAQYEKDLAAYEDRKRDKRTRVLGSDKPKEPVAVRYYCSDVTVEAMAGLLRHAPRGLLLMRDELSGWVRGFDAYKNRKGNDAAGWLELHRAGTLMVDRKSGTARTIHVPMASVSVCGGIQPQILSQALGTEHFENGLAARLLLAMPPRVAKRWTEEDVDREVVEELEGVFDGLLEMAMAPSATGGSTPVDVPLTESGKAAWVAFYNEHAAEQDRIGGGDLAAAWSKLEGYAARLALVVHCVWAAGGGPGLEGAGAVDARSVAAGVAMVRWFGAEAARIYAVLKEGDEEREQRRLAEMVRARGGRITARELMHGCRAFRGSAESARAELQELVDLGWGSWEQVAPTENGGRPSEVFVLGGMGGNKTPV
jgi:hypothetical protein